MVIRSSCTANFRKPLEDTDHALAVLDEETTRLLRHVLVLNPSRKHSRYNHPENGCEEVIVLAKRIRVVDVWKGQCVLIFGWNC